MSDASLRIGVVGACGRGGSFAAACQSLGVTVEAVCDTHEAGLPEAARRLSARESYTDYERMLDRADLDAVIVATPVFLHAPQTIAALERGIHVLCEVPAAPSVEACRAMTLAVRRSKATFMLAENYIYRKQNVIVRELVRRGRLGTPYYAEAEYIHELKALNEQTPWRRKWLAGVNGNTYPTHSLGPILQWMVGDRVESVCCAGSGHHYRDPRGELYENEDSTVTLCRMRSGGLVKLRLDMLSQRPHAMTNYQLQGTGGCYESARAAGERHRVWLGSGGDDAKQWADLDGLAEEFLPERWRRHADAAHQSGHGGGDYFELLDFLDACRGERPSAVGVDEAMDMTLPGLISQQSIEQEGRWLAVPDSRLWTPAQPGGADGRPRRQLQMIFPQETPPSTQNAESALPEGYALRVYRPSDEAPFGQLMARAGFEDWSGQRIADQARGILPGGFFIVEERATGRPVATAQARHGTTHQHPEAGELGWVAADPDHAGRGLGRVACAAAVGLMRERGYRRIFLLTDDLRLPAIKTYLNVGFRPHLDDPDAAERWRAVGDKLGVRTV